MNEKTELIVFRCSESFKNKIVEWAKSHHMQNLSAGCRELINLELNREENVVEAAAFSTEYSRFLQSNGYINAQVPSEELEQVAKAYADYLHSGNREFK